jgi:hypothetical protein
MQQALHLATYAVNDILPTHATVEKRDHKDKYEYGSNDENIEEHHMQDNAPGDTAIQLALFRFHL